MKTPITEMLGCEFPLLAFSHCRDVVVAVSKAGGFGVLGALNHTPESIEIELKWIDDHIDGKPYGVDVVFAENLATSGETGLTYGALKSRVPERHRAFTADLLAAAGVDAIASQVSDDRAPPFDHESAAEVLRVAFRHPIRLIANALGVPPKAMIDMGHEHGVPVAALIGSREHAIRQVNAGVDILVCQGTEAGGHCGEVTTMVLVPEVLRSVKPIKPEVAVLAAGGIMTGQQMAAAMAMGADGVWTGSVWLATPESGVPQVIIDKFIEASSRDAVRTKARTGKPCRQLRSAWTEAWERSPESPGALPMPLQSMISENALRSIERSAEAGNPKAREMVTSLVGQGVGLIEGVRSSGQIVQDFKAEFLDAVERMNGLLGD